MLSEIRKFERDRNSLINKGMREASRLGRAARRAVIDAYVGAGDVANAAVLELRALEPVLLDAMVTAHLYGRSRSITMAAIYHKKHPSTKIGFGPYDTALEFIKKRMELTETQLFYLRTKYSDTATNVTRGLGVEVERRARQASAEIVEQGMHVREGKKHLWEAMGKAGIESPNPWLLETLVRMQITIAYSAGRWNANQNPAIASIVWGYEYFTAGDDRVRPSHVSLDTVKLPKEDPAWNEIWPPNGFNCRCDTVEVFVDESHKIKEVPEPFEIDGKMVRPGADEDWDYNPGVVYSDMLA